MPLIHCVLCWYEAWKTSEGSIPSIGLGRVRTPYDFLHFYFALSTRPDSWPVAVNRVVQLYPLVIAHYKFRKAL